MPGQEDTWEPMFGPHDSGGSAMQPDTLPLPPVEVSRDSGGTDLENAARHVSRKYGKPMEN